MKKLWFLVFALLVVSAALWVLQQNTDSDNTSPDDAVPNFKILLSDHYQNLTAYAGDDVYADPVELDKLLDQVDFTELLISDADIERYDWDNQEIILSSTASEKIRERYTDDIFSFQERLFLITLDNQQIYGGTVLSIGSERAIDYPVMYIVIEDENKPVSLFIRPAHDMPITTFQESNSQYKSLIESDQLKSFFAQSE